MAYCFCGCGRKVKGFRRSVANKISDRMRTDIAFFRGGVADRLVSPDEVAGVEALVREGEARLEWMGTYVHGMASRADMDKPGLRAWLDRAKSVRATVMTGVGGLGFHGGGLHLPDLLYAGGRARGSITQLRDTGTTINERPRVEITVEVTPERGTAFQATNKMLLSRVDLPRVGDIVEVAYDLADRNDFAFRRVVPAGASGA